MIELRIKDICTKGSSSLKQKDVEKLSGDYPVYGASGQIAAMQSYHQEDDYIAIVKDGSGIGRVMFLPAKSSVIGTMQYILPKSGYDINYIGYCLQSLDLSIYKQGAAIPHIYFRDYGERLVKVEESLTAQKEIVAKINAEFAKIDQIKSNAKKALDEAKCEFLSIVSESMDGDKDWISSSLKDISISLTDGDHLPPPKSSSGIPFITISDIDKDNGGINLTNTFHVPVAYYNSLKESRKAHRGDILYTVTGSFGIPVLISTDENFCFQRHIALIKPKKDILLPEFLFFYLLTPEMQAVADKVATGATQRTVSLSSLRQFVIKYPKDIQEQIRITELLY